MNIIEELNKISDKERKEIFSNYCIYCGSKEKKCKCWNDE